MQRILVGIVALLAFVLSGVRPPLLLAHAGGHPELATTSAELARVPAPRIVRGEAPRAPRADGALAAVATTRASGPLAAASESLEPWRCPPGTWVSPAKTSIELMVFLN